MPGDQWIFINCPDEWWTEHSIFLISIHVQYCRLKSAGSLCFSLNLERRELKLELSKSPTDSSITEVVGRAKKILHECTLPKFGHIPFFVCSDTEYHGFFLGRCGYFLNQRQYCGLYFWGDGKFPVPLTKITKSEGGVWCQQ